MIIIIVGPPGSGKSTQAKRLAKKIEVPAISIGQLLRDAKKSGTEIGKEAAKYVERGELVPSKMIEALTRFRIREDDCKEGFVLDGAPRRVEEAVALDSVLEEQGRKIARVFYIEVPEKEIIKRLVKRSTLPEEKGGGRVDDNMEDIKVRIQEFRDNINPLKKYYQDKEIFEIIEGKRTRDEIQEDIRNKLRL